jgi:hypothetical protein
MKIHIRDAEKPTAYVQTSDDGKIHQLSFVAEPPPGFHITEELFPKQICDQWQPGDETKLILKEKQIVSEYTERLLAMDKDYLIMHYKEITKERDRLAEECRDFAAQHETDAGIIKASGKEIHFLRDRRDDLVAALEEANKVIEMKNFDMRTLRDALDVDDWIGEVRMIDFIDSCISIAAMRKGSEMYDPSDNEMALLYKIAEITKQRDELIRSVEMTYKMLLSEPDTKGALFKAENLLREALAEVKFTNSSGD